MQEKKSFGTHLMENFYTRDDEIRIGLSFDQVYADFIIAKAENIANTIFDQFLDRIKEIRERKGTNKSKLLAFSKAVREASVQFYTFYNLVNEFSHEIGILEPELFKANRVSTFKSIANSLYATAGALDVNQKMINGVQVLTDIELYDVLDTDNILTLCCLHLAEDFFNTLIDDDFRYEQFLLKNKNPDENDPLALTRYEKSEVHYLAKYFGQIIKKI